MKLDISIVNWEIQVSDWYHSFEDLYEHRHLLYIALCNSLKFDRRVIKSRLHNDWSEYEWWFIMQTYTDNWKQISYHLPNRLRDACKCDERHKADERDWHSTDDVLQRLLEI